MSDDFRPEPLVDRLLPTLSDADRENLQSAVSELFHRQAILRSLPGDGDLYDWAHNRMAWIREACGLIGFDVFLDEDEQMIHAIPRDRATLRKLRTEWTLVLLALWYDYDVQLRAEGAPVVFTVETFNESLKTKLGDRQPSPTSLREILAFFVSKKLVKMNYIDAFHRSEIEVLPTIRFVLPFGEIERVATALDDLLANPTEEEPDDG